MTNRTLRVGSAGADVLELQHALNARGAKLETDGEFGEATKAAVIRFQKSKAIRADGVVGPKTRSALQVKVQPGKEELPWAVVALGLEGRVFERPGKENDPVIVEMHRIAGLPPKMRHDATAWCSSAHKYVYVKAGIPESMLSDMHAWARDWLEFGVPCGFKKWCTVVLERNGKGGDSHVTFGLRIEGDRILVLGGNQSNSFKLSWYKTKDVLGYRWPSKAMLAAMGLETAA